MASENEVEVILNADTLGAKEALKKFIENVSISDEPPTSKQTSYLQNSATFNFSHLDLNDSRKLLLQKLFNFLQSAGAKSLHKDCLIVVRILCRDKRDLDNILDLQHLDILKNCAGLEKEAIFAQSKLDHDTQTEALKCLCNIIYNSPVAATHCSKNGMIEGIIERMKYYQRCDDFPLDIKVFDMKVLFLITALCDETRGKLKNDLEGIKNLSDVLKAIINNSKENKNDEGASSSSQRTLLKEEANFTCEILKVLFNLTVAQNEEEEPSYKQLLDILRELLIISVNDQTAKFEIINNLVNLMTNMPISTYRLLYQPIKKGEEIPDKMKFEGRDMRAIDEMLLLLENKFSSEISVRNQPEVLAPILTVLVKGVSCDKTLRKYLRQKVLPPLRDVHTRPEEGNTLRNNLCRLLTTPMTNVRDLAADLLFILCKENVGRMIKYTGYGNAAGLFANRGLLGGGRSGKDRYSSDSEDSDTEEYREHKHGINPVIGCYETPRPSPMADMTEEQKEHEAMKLVDLMESLTRTGIIQPCTIGKDGRPQPIEHVLQLREGLQAQQVYNIEKSDD